MKIKKQRNDPNTETWKTPVLENSLTFSADYDEEQESTDEKEHNEEEDHTDQEDDDENHKYCNKLEKISKKVRMKNKWRIMQMFNNSYVKFNQSSKPKAKSYVKWKLIQGKVLSIQRKTRVVGMYFLKEIKKWLVWTRTKKQVGQKWNVLNHFIFVMWKDLLKTLWMQRRRN